MGSAAALTARGFLVQRIQVQEVEVLRIHRLDAAHRLVVPHRGCVVRVVRGVENAVSVVDGVCSVPIGGQKDRAQAEVAQQEA